SGFSRARGPSHLFPVAQSIPGTGVQHGPAQDLVNVLNVVDILQDELGGAGVVAPNVKVAEVQHALSERLGLFDILDSDQLDVFALLAQNPSYHPDPLRRDLIMNTERQEGAPLPEEHLAGVIVDHPARRGAGPALSLTQ